MAEDKPKEVLTVDREHYVLDNLKLVHHLLHKYIKPHPNDYDDCYQEGCIGLTLAAIRFDETAGYGFTSYAVPMILGTVRTYLRNKRPLIRYSANMINLYTKIQQLKLDGLDDAGIMRHLNIGSSMYFEILNMNNTLSLDHTFGEDDSLSLAGTLGYTDKYFQSDKDFEESLEKVVSNLSDVYKAIYEEYIHSLYFGKKLTVRYLAQKHGISRTTVSKILKKLNTLYVKVLKDSDII